MFEELGFQVLLCKQDAGILIYDDDNDYRGILQLFLAVPHNIPEHSRKEFEDELFNCIVKSNGRNSNGHLEEPLQNSNSPYQNLRMLFQDPNLYYEIHKLTGVDCEQLLDYVLPKMSFQEDDTVLDIGSGLGDNTRNLIKARIPKLKKLVAVDVLPHMVEFARTHFADEKIEYHVADIEDRSSLKTWEASIAKAFSVHCFYLLKDQKKAFQNLYDLLKPSGEAALVFVLSLRFWDFYEEMINCVKWNRYLKDADQRVADSHRLNLGEDYYKKLLEDLGFEVLVCEKDDRDFHYSDDNIFKNVLKSILSLPYYIPEEMRQEFLDELFNCILKRDGRNSDGHLTQRYTALTLHIRKH